MQAYKIGLNKIVVMDITLTEPSKLTHIRKFLILDEKTIYNKLKVIIILSGDRQGISSKIKNETRIPTLPFLINIVLEALVDVMRAYDPTKNCGPVVLHKTNTISLSIYSSRILQDPYTTCT